MLAADMLTVGRGLINRIRLVIQGHPSWLGGGMGFVLHSYQVFGQENHVSKETGG